MEGKCYQCDRGIPKENQLCWCTDCDKQFCGMGCFIDYHEKFEHFSGHTFNCICCPTTEIKLISSFSEKL